MLLTMKIIPFYREAAECSTRFSILLILLLLVAQAGQAAEIAYYSDGKGVVMSTGNTIVNLVATDDAANLQLTATVATTTSGPVAVRLPLTGTGQQGFRAGVLVSTANSSSLLGLSQILQLQTLGTVTLRTYLGSVLK
jgi:hypothetical protein